MNIFYGAGVPACLLILGNGRPKGRRDKVLLVYAARHFRELSNKNQLRPQDVMRVLVHYHASGDAAKAAKLVKQHGTRLKKQIDAEGADEIGRIRAEFDEKFGKSGRDTAPATGRGGRVRQTAEAARDERIADAEKRADEELAAIDAVGVELVKLYADPAELAKHARVVDVEEIVENDYNLNIPRYVDTFEPEEPIDVADALRELELTETARANAEKTLRQLLRGVGYGE